MQALAMRIACTAPTRAATAATRNSNSAAIARAAPLAAAKFVRGRGEQVRRRAALVSAQAEAEASASNPSEEAPAAAAEAAAVPAADDAAAASSSSSTTSARFGLNFLWLDKNVGVAVDALYPRAEGSSAPAARAPLTEYFMWPRKDAWEELKAALEAKPWVPERDRVLLLNRTTEVINFWQDEGTKHTVDEAREKFPDCVFSSS